MYGRLFRPFVALLVGAALTDQPTPVEVAGGHTDWTAVGAGSGHACGIRNGGRLYCWGDDAHGQLGDGTIGGDRTVPNEVAGGGT